MPEPYPQFLWYTKDGAIPVDMMDNKHLISAFLSVSKEFHDKYNEHEVYEPAFNAPLHAELSWRVSCPEIYWVMAD
jgi:hypothetical protein